MHVCSRGAINQERQLFPFGTRLLVLAFLLAAACGLRLYRIGDPPFDFQPTRQYRSALIARWYYLMSVQSIPEWEKQVAGINMCREGINEPPVMEFIAAVGYRVTGKEELWIPRACSSLFWVIGGLLLYGLTARLTSTDAAVFATAIYLFIPFGVRATRSFQPDSLMMMLSLAGIYQTVRYCEKPSCAGWALAAVLSSAAVFIKPVAAFWMLGAFFACALYHFGFKGAVSRVWCWLFIPSVFSLATVYYAYALMTRQFSLGWTGGRCIPHLLMSGFFWRGWMQRLLEVIGGPYLLIALLGLLWCLLHDGAARALLTGLWAGYAAFCMVFTWHAPSHNYYHLPLIPVAVISMAMLICYVLTRAARVCPLGLLRIVASCALLMIVVHGVSRSRAMGVPHWRLREMEIAREVGERVGHSPRTVYLSNDYGKPLSYYGELAGVNWPHRYDFVHSEACGAPPIAAEERFRALGAQYPLDYFIVTDLQELDVQKDLKQFLAERFAVTAQSQDYLIFDLRKGLGGDKRVENR